MMKMNDAMKPGRRRILQAGGAAVASLAVGVLPLVARAQDHTGKGMKIGIIGSGRIGGTLGE